VLERRDYWFYCCLGLTTGVSVRISPLLGTDFSQGAALTLLRDAFFSDG